MQVCGHRARVHQQALPALHGVDVRTKISRVTSGSHICAASSVETAVSRTEIHDGRLPFLQTLEQFVRPQEYARKVLQNNRQKYAWGKASLPPQDTIFVADPVALRSWMASEWQNGICIEWPASIRALLGDCSISVQTDPDTHTRLRQIMAPYFNAEAIQRIMPGIYDTVARHLARWEAEGTVSVDAAARLLTFDVLVNQALGLQMGDTEIRQFSQVYQTWLDGFIPPAIELPFLPFGKGMAARRVLQQRIRQSLNNPNLPADCLLARLRDEFGADSDIATDNVITLLFAGHDTTSSTISYMLWQLAQHPHIVQKLREEHAAVRAQHGELLTPAAVAALQYTAAVMKETLRLAQIVAYVPRVASKPLKAAGGPDIPSGCPFIVALSSMSASDPAVAPDSSNEQQESLDAHWQQFRPDRWLEPENARSLALHQMPFGIGQHYCLGSQLAMAELTAVLSVLMGRYSFQVDTNATWADFPIKRSSNGLPCKLTPL